MDWRSWKYKNITILVLTFICSLALGSFKPFHESLFALGYSAAFFAGVIFISTFTAPISAAMLLILAERYPLPYLAVFAILGAVISDFFFFNFVKDGLAKEITPIYEGLANKSHLGKLINTKHFRWLFPVLGILVIFSPLPKTSGVQLLGISKLKPQQFVLLSLGFNILGIIFILLLSFVIKP